MTLYPYAEKPYAGNPRTGTDYVNTTLGLHGASRVPWASFVGKGEEIAQLLQLPHHLRGGFNSAHGGLSA